MDKLAINLHRSDELILERSREIGLVLVIRGDDRGQPLMDAVDAVLDAGVAQASDDNESE